MKKLMIAAVMVCAVACANAIPSNWGFIVGDPVMTADGSGYYNGEMLISCEALNYEKTVIAENGEFWDAGLGIESTYGAEYTFTLTAETATHTHTYLATGVGVWQTSSGGCVTFDAGTWTAVPEPTSGLLMLLGVAGLALKRKRA